MRRAFTLIELMIVIAIIAIIAAIAIPNLLEARKHGNESSAIGSLKTIIASQAIYVERNAARRYGDLTALRNDGYVDDVLGGGAKQGYNFSIVFEDLTLGPIPAGRVLDSQYEFFAGARPAILDQTGNRYFITNQSGVIRFKTDGEATFAPDSVYPAPIGGK